MRYLIVMTPEGEETEPVAAPARIVETDADWYVGDRVLLDDLALEVQAAIAGPWGYDATLYCAPAAPPEAQAEQRPAEG